MRKIILLIIGLILSAGTITAGQSGEESADSVKLVKFNVFGALKTKVEFDTYNSLVRFNVRNSRIGFNGDLTRSVGYQVQSELSSEGNFTMLDLYGSVEFLKGFNVVIGQASIPFYNGYTVTPGVLMFANRPFIGKFFSGTRDIGAKIEYKLPIEDVPVIIEAGIYNGGSINNPQWTDAPSFGARVSLGSMKGFRSTIKYFHIAEGISMKKILSGIDFRYATDRMKVETEFVNMQLNNVNQASYYVQGGYSVPLNSRGQSDRSRLFDSFVPAIRWDAIGQRDNKAIGFDINRLTLGIGLTLTKKTFDSIIRLDYEHYFMKDDIDLTKYAGAHFYNKISLELLINF